jgi:adenylyltransferase/sulfurtransferase
MAAEALDPNVVESSRDYSRLDATIFNRARLSALNVMVVGAGALGNEVIKNLTLLGVGTTYIVDRDLIESSNLTRSVLFCVPQIAQIISNRTWKAEFAASRVREINPEVRAVAITGEIADVGLGILRRMDLIFSCLDNELARLELSWACQRVDVPLVDGGLGLTNYSGGLVSLFPGSAGPCYACGKGRQRRRELLQELNGTEDPCWMKEQRLEQQGAIPTTPLMASVVAAMQVEVGLRHVLSESSSRSEGKSIRVSLAPEPSMECFSFSASPSCSLHAAKIDDVIQLSESRSDSISVAELILAAKDGSGSEDGMLCLDWPLVVEASCDVCDSVWKPMLRRTRFQRGANCPSCGKNGTEREVITSIDLSSPWASAKLTQLGLPQRHIHEVYWDGSGSSTRYVEVAGDWQMSDSVSTT